MADLILDDHGIEVLRKAGVLDSDSNYTLRVNHTAWNINNDDLYETIDGKPVLRTAPLANTSILSVFITSFLDGVTYDSVVSVISPDNTQTLTAYNGTKVAKILEVTYDGINWSLVRVARDLESDDGLALESDDGQTITED